MMWYWWVAGGFALYVLFMIGRIILKSMDDNQDKRVSYTEWIRFAYLLLVYFAVIVEGLSLEDRFSDIEMTALIACTFGSDVFVQFLKMKQEKSWENLEP